MNSLALSAALLLLAPLATSPPAQRTITKSEIRRDSPHRTNLRLRDTVWDMFVPEDLRGHGAPPRFPLRRILLNTRPRGTDVPSLCRSDLVDFEFAPAGPKAGADTPVQAVGLEVDPKFHFIVPPAGPYRSVVRDGLVATEGGCGSLSLDKTSFFSADSAEIATNGYRAFLNLQDALRSARAVPLDCDLFPGETRNCKDIILGFGQDDIGFIEACDILNSCFAIHAGERKVTVRVDGESELKVAGAKLVSMITFADSLID